MTMQRDVKRFGYFAGVATFLVAGGLVATAQAQHAHHAEDHAANLPDAPAEHVMGHGDQKIVMYDLSEARRQNHVRRKAQYDAPSIILRDQNNEEVNIRDLLAGDRPVAMQFIFTSCSTVCPVLSAGFAQSEAGILDVAPDARLVSITIDPQYDTPARLKAYAERYKASENWRFLTGSLKDIRDVIAAFDAVLESDNKMYHRPYTYFRGRSGDSWVRTEGLLSGNSMLAEFTGILEQQGDSSAAAGGD